jgi:hypothetical protein
MSEDRLAAATSMLAGPEPPPADAPTPVGGGDNRFRTEPTASVGSLLESVRQVRGWVREDMQMLSPYAIEAKQLLSSKGKELLGAATQVSAVASQTLKATAAEARLDWRAYLGGDDGGAALCGACAAPFSHGLALAPELRRFEQHFDRCAEDVATLRLASDQLRACEQALGGDELRAALAPVPAVAALESRRDCHRDELEAQAIAAATADRRDFVAALEAGAKATDELCESAEAEEALRHLRAKGSREASLSLDLELEGAPA